MFAWKNKITIEEEKGKRFSLLLLLFYLRVFNEPFKFKKMKRISLIEAFQTKRFFFIGKKGINTRTTSYFNSSPFEHF